MSNSQVKKESFLIIHQKANCKTNAVFLFANFMLKETKWLLENVGSIQTTSREDSTVPASWQDELSMGLVYWLKLVSLPAAPIICIPKNSLPPATKIYIQNKICISVL